MGWYDKIREGVAKKRLANELELQRKEKYIEAPIKKTEQEAERLRIIREAAELKRQRLAREREEGLLRIAAEKRAENERMKGIRKAEYERKTAWVRKIGQGLKGGYMAARADIRSFSRHKRHHRRRKTRRY